MAGALPASTTGDDNGTSLAKVAEAAGVSKATLFKQFPTKAALFDMAALFRIVIAELPRFPELSNAHFERGKMPYFDSVRR